MGILNNMKDNYQHIPYTFKHKVAMLKLEKQFKGHNSLRIIIHDVDKILFYALLPFLPKKTINSMHTKLNKHHHTDDLTHSRAIWEEMVLDWESARYTKPDKPMNAVDFCIKFRPHLYEYLEPVFKDWNLI